MRSDQLAPPATRWPGPDVPELPTPAPAIPQFAVPPRRPVGVPPLPLACCVCIAGLLEGNPGRWLHRDAFAPSAAICRVMPTTPAWWCCRNGAHRGSLRKDRRSRRRSHASPFRRDPRFARHLLREHEAADQVEIVTCPRPRADCPPPGPPHAPVVDEDIDASDFATCGQHPVFCRRLPCRRQGVRFDSLLAMCAPRDRVRPACAPSARIGALSHSLGDCRPTRASRRDDGGAPRSKSSSPAEISRIFLYSDASIAAAVQTQLNPQPLHGAQLERCSRPLRSDVGASPRSGSFGLARWRTSRFAATFAGDATYQSSSSTPASLACPCRASTTWSPWWCPPRRRRGAL